MPVEPMRQVEVIVAAVRDEIERLRGECRDEHNRLGSDLRSLATQGAATQVQLGAHLAVCDERQKVLVQRQADNDRWSQTQGETFAKFMAESSSDRAAIHLSVQAARVEIKDGVIKVLIWLITLSIPGILGGVGWYLKTYGPRW